MPNIMADANQINQALLISALMPGTQWLTAEILFYGRDDFGAELGARFHAVKAERYAWISVADTAWESKKRSKRVFEPFFSTKAGQGTALVFQ